MSLSSTPKIGIFHAALQMLGRGFVTFNQSHGKNTVKNLINLRSTSFFSIHRTYLYSIHISLLVFKNNSRNFKMVP